ncbi:MAG TPA: hypothetical protein VFF36_17735, partial [Planctomycetota bacterium]|nr:hypothetical protein [Planctomycetota bacterium]
MNVRDRNGFRAGRPEEIPHAGDGNPAILSAFGEHCTMAPRPTQTRFRIFALASGVLLLVVLASCGGHKYTTGPELRAAAMKSALPADPPPADYLPEVAVLPASGVNVHQLADDFGATVAPGSNYICVRFLPQAGETPAQLAARLMGDPRVIVAEQNAIIETAEARQESYASDDGNGSLEA